MACSSTNIKRESSVAHLYQSSMGSVHDKIRAVDYFDPVHDEKHIRAVASNDFLASKRLLHAENERTKLRELGAHHQGKAKMNIRVIRLGIFLRLQGISQVGGYPRFTSLYKKKPLPRGEKKLQDEYVLDSFSS
ncbi:hypothetical protein ACLOJK_007442 [Asimina triloba]